MTPAPGVDGSYGNTANPPVRRAPALSPVTAGTEAQPGETPSPGVGGTTTTTSAQQRAQLSGNAQDAPGGVGPGFGDAATVSHNVDNVAPGVVAPGAIGPGGLVTSGPATNP